MARTPAKAGSARAGVRLAALAAAISVTLTAGCAVEWSGTLVASTAGFGAGAPALAPARRMADLQRDLEALARWASTGAPPGELEAIAERPLPAASGPELDVALLARALAQRLRNDHLGLAQTRDAALQRGTRPELVLQVLTLHAAAMRTAGLARAAREAFSRAEQYMLAAARRAGSPAHRLEAAGPFLQEYLFAARHFGDTPLGDRLLAQYLDPLVHDDTTEPGARLIARMYADEYRITQRTTWGGGDPLEAYQALQALIESHWDAVARLSGHAGRAARHKLMDLRIQAGHLALRAHRPSLAAAQVQRIEVEGADEMARRFAVGELRGATALAGHDFERALEEMDATWRQAPAMIRHLDVVRAGHQIGRAGVLASLGRWDDALRELDAIRIDPSYLALVDQYAGLRTVVRSMTGRDDPDFAAFAALEPKYRDGSQGVDRSVLYFAARTLVFQRRAARTGSVADAVKAVDAGRRMGRFLRLQQAAGATDRWAIAPSFLRLAKEAYVLAAVRALGRPGVQVDDLLDAVQLQQTSDIDRDVAAAAIRQRAFPGIEAGDLRLLQDLQRRMAAAQAALGAALAAVDGDPAETRRRVDDANAAGALLDAQLATMTRRAPGIRYAFGAADPVSLRDIQSRLAEDEALLSAAPMSTSTVVVMVTKRGVAHRMVPVGRADVAGLVERVRRSTDLSGFARLPDFDVDAARELHRVLLGWHPQGLRGLRTLTVAASGPLGALPFGLLVRDSPPHEAAVHYRRVPWLIRAVALTHVPSLSSWLALSEAPAAGRVRGFIAWADPEFGSDGAPVSSTALGVRASLRELRRLAPAAAHGASGLAMPALPRLPETRGEAQAMAWALRAAGDADIVVGRAATRRSVLQRSSSGDLARRSVVLFATHGLDALQVPGLDQPALAMAHDALDSAPALLTLEDVLGLRLQADWVILSACNTAAADREGGDPLSGLSRGFLFAGARALLVTHWEVESESAAELTTRTVEVFARQAGLSRAQALQQASLALIDARGTPEAWAHPAYWAPFALVGDGGRRGARGAPPGGG